MTRSCFSAGPSQFLILKEKEQNHLFPQPRENLHVSSVLKPAAEHRRGALGATRHAPNRPPHAGVTRGELSMETKQFVRQAVNMFISAVKF